VGWNPEKEEFLKVGLWDLDHLKRKKWATKWQKTKRQKLGKAGLGHHEIK